MSRCDLSKIPVEVLIDALLERKAEFFKEEIPGMLIASAFKLRLALGVVSCVDGLPYRCNDNGEIELMAQRRSTGAYPGKLVLVGGTVFKGEAIKGALERHFRDDFGVEIKISEEPFCVTQYRKKANAQWLCDPAKEHVIAPVYLIQILAKTPAYSCQGDPVEWFSKDRIPADKEFGYTNERIYHNAFRFLLKSRKN